MYWSNMTHREWWSLNRDSLSPEQQIVFEELLNKLEELEEEIEEADRDCYYCAGDWDD